MPDSSEDYQRKLIARVEDALEKLGTSRKAFGDMLERATNAGEETEHLKKMIEQTDLADKILRRALVKIKGALNPRVTGAYVIDWNKLSGDIERYTKGGE